MKLISKLVGEDEVMMKQGKVLFCIMVLSMVVVFSGLDARVYGAGAVLSNLILDGGFEAVSGSRVQVWKEDSRGGWGEEMIDSFRGNNSLKATVAGSWLSQEVRVKAKTAYILRAYVRSDIRAPEREDDYNTFLTLECLDWRKRVIKRAMGMVNVASSWQLRENTVSTPLGTIRMRVKLAKGEGEGSVWFDELKLTQISQDLPLNGDFEIITEAGKPEFWEEDSNEGWFPDIGESYGGTSSVRATVAWSWLSQEIPATPETVALAISSL